MVLPGGRRHRDAVAVCVSHRCALRSGMETMSKNTRQAEDEDAEALKQETAKISKKIDGAFEKLAKKLRDKADRAKDKLDTTKHKAKRAIQLRRFELYADAAKHLEERMSQREDIPDYIDN